MMGFPIKLLIPKLNILLINLSNITDNTLNHKQSINLYYKNQLNSNYKRDEHILKNLIQKKCSPYWPYQKSKLYHLLQQIQNLQPYYF